MKKRTSSMSRRVVSLLMSLVLTLTLVTPAAFATEVVGGSGTAIIEGNANPADANPSGDNEGKDDENKDTEHGGDEQPTNPGDEDKNPGEGDGGSDDANKPGEDNKGKQNTEDENNSEDDIAPLNDDTHFGKDADGNDINLIADGVYDRGKTIDIGAQGLNGWLWGLITLDSMKYNIPAGSSYTRTEMIKRILSFQLPDNGFNLRFAQGSTADPDITAMAIQALAPYYRNSTFNVKDPVDKALDCLSKLQLDTGDFRSWGTRNSESVSQIIVSLCSIGVDPQNDSRFIKNGINLLDALFYYQQEDGGFAHSYESDPGNPSAIPGESNSIATDQALLALVAVWRQTQGMSILYDFRPGSVSAKILTPEESEVSFAGSYEFTEADQQQADALPKKLSTENDAEVTALLDKLKMSRDFEGYDTYMTKLTQAKSDIDALYAEIESINADIESQIVPMTDPGLGEKSTVDRLVKRYKALSDHDKELIQNWDAVLAVKVQTDAAQRDLFLIIGGVVVVMVAVTVVVRRRRESQ